MFERLQTLKNVYGQVEEAYDVAPAAAEFIVKGYYNLLGGLEHAVAAVAIGLFVGVIAAAVVAGNLASAPAFLAGAVAFLTPHLAVPLAALGLSTASAPALSTGLVVGGSVALLLLTAAITYMVIDQTLVGVGCVAKAVKKALKSDRYASI